MDTSEEPSLEDMEVRRDIKHDTPLNENTDTSKSVTFDDVGCVIASPLLSLDFYTTRISPPFKSAIIRKAHSTLLQLCQVLRFLTSKNWRLDDQALTIRAAVLVIRL